MVPLADTVAFLAAVDAPYKPSGKKNSLNLPGLTPHRLRATFATNHARAGTPVATLQVWLEVLFQARKPGPATRHAQAEATGWNAAHGTFPTQPEHQETQP